LKCLSTPTDIADAVLYLATAKAVTGQVIRVDGGAHQVAWARDFMHLDG
jgi:pteridine reductase